MRFRSNASRHQTVIAATVLTLAVCLLPAASTSDLPGQSEKEMDLTQQLSKDASSRNQAVDTVLKEREVAVKKLIGLVDPANAQRYDDEARSAAAFLLGELRAVEAVPALSKALADAPGAKIELGTDRFVAPVSTALMKIGRPVVPAMIENIETSDNEALTMKSLDVLNHVLGGKRRLLEVLETFKTRAEGHQAKADRIDKASKWAQGHYKEEQEPPY